MAQIIVYGHKSALVPRIASLSDAIHTAAVSALQLPVEKRFHRFIPLDPEYFLAPSDRSIDYTIIEVSMFEGRTTATKKDFIRQMISSVAAIGVAGNDLEITITETPRANWGIRGVPADELQLTYPVKV
ncbi:tautomerase family protein [Mycetocola zhadangensis]|uniref:Tautomerase family protein n=1 Tax=Mycetocola zhadangensis TaxID=1164595 RepID=A0A3L7JCW5_9MICO|nr:tautomerase family protein [Mycetocola zhadangensis]RLQ86332.1 tautomerase family protein [Mycetocola zhadangensis]GGE90246.1 tautomerase [Mycetocola zhadangensis]